MKSEIVTDRARGARKDLFNAAVLGVFGAISLWVLALDLWQVIAHGRHWTGTDGVYLVDQLQYLAWIREAARHVLISNLFVLRSTPADYFQPAIVLSGGLSALGVAPWLSLLVWKPVAVAACFYAVRQYVARSLADRSERRAALVLALFFGSFTIVYGSVGTIGDLFLGFLSWGYPFALLALALILGALLCYDRARSRGRFGLLPGALGAAATLLHPWNGELLIAVVLASEAAMRLGRSGPRRRLALAAVTVLITAAPLVYYALLGRLDSSWQLARVASKHSFPLWSILLAVFPLLVPAVAAYRKRPQTFLSAATRTWPFAAAAIYALSASELGATPLHTFQGITIPLAVLAVEGLDHLGWRRLPQHRWLALAAIAAFTIPATVDQLLEARELASPQPGSARFVDADERRALDYLAHDPDPGGVISRSYLGALVPGATGRHTFVGDCVWSEPDCDRRLVAVRRLFTESLAPRTARAFVLRTRARFVLADCRPNTDLARRLGPIIEAMHTFGCARVYKVQ